MGYTTFPPFDPREVRVASRETGGGERRRIIFSVCLLKKKVDFQEDMVQFVSEKRAIG